MRTTFYVILAALLLGGGFALYLMRQGPLATVASPETNVPPLKLDPNRPSINGSGPGDRPWMKKIDEKGRLRSQFRAKEYQPRGDGTTVYVKGVEADFFSYPADSKNPNRVQRVRIEGRDGNVELPEASKQGSNDPFAKTPNTQPKRGRLNQVVMRLFPDYNSPDSIKRRETITMETNNLAFDNETFEVTTEAIKDMHGEVFVPADEVPIHVTGDYDFDGRGMKLRWNDVDGRLELLEIAHGEFLQINHPGDMSSMGQRRKSTPPPSGAQPTAQTDASAENTDAGPLRDTAGKPVMLAAKGTKPPAGTAATMPATQPHKPPQPPYNATFFEDVRVSQGIRGVSEEELASGDLMRIDFRTGSDHPTTKPTTGPSTQPTTAATASTLPTTEPTTAPALADAGATTLPATQPTTQPSRPPVIVRWNGMLRIIPIEPTAADFPATLQAGESILRLIGTKAPVMLSMAQINTKESSKNSITTARCAFADYYSADSRVFLRNSEQYRQVVLTQMSTASSNGVSAPRQDTTVVSEGPIEYSDVERIANVRGRGHAHMLSKNNSSATQPVGTPPRVVDAKWGNSAVLKFFQPEELPASTSDKADKSDDDRLIKQITLDGDADVKDPQLAIKSRTLDMSFDPPRPSTRPTTGPSTNPAADDAALASAVNAAALAETTHPTTGPTTKPDRQSNLRTLVAIGNVWCEIKEKESDVTTGEIKDKQTSTATGDRLKVDMSYSDDGKSYPKIVDIQGNANVAEPARAIQADHIHATLVPVTKDPTTQPSAHASTQPTTHPSESGLGSTPVGLDTMTATGKVLVHGADGSTATGDQLFVVMEDRLANTRLVGAPEARVLNEKKDLLIGPVITASQKQNTATVEGPGRMQMIKRDQDPPRPVDVSWVTGAFVNTPENWVDIYGPVEVVTPDPNKTIMTATSKRMRIELADAPPTTRPTTRPTSAAAKHKSGPQDPVASVPAQQAAATLTGPPIAATAVTAESGLAPTTQPQGKKPHKEKSADKSDSSGSMDVMSKKVPTAIVLRDDAVVRSKLLADDGSVLQESVLNSSLIRYELPDDGPKPSKPESSSSPTTVPSSPSKKGKLIVPRPGTLLTRDHRPASARNAAQQAGGEAEGGGNRGATAFQWSHDLVYDKTEQTANINGDVVIVHRDDQPNALPLRLQSQHVLATFEQKKALPKSTTKPTTKPAEEPPPQLKFVVATGQVTVLRNGQTLTGDRIDFDPATGWITALGTDRNPAVIYNAAGVPTHTATRLLWNNKTGDVKANKLSSLGGK